MVYELSMLASCCCPGLPPNPNPNADRRLGVLAAAARLGVYLKIPDMITHLWCGNGRHRLLPPLQTHVGPLLHGDADDSLIKTNRINGALAVMILFHFHTFASILGFSMMDMN